MSCEQPPMYNHFYKIPKSTTNRTNTTETNRTQAPMDLNNDSDAGGGEGGQLPLERQPYFPVPSPYCAQAGPAREARPVSNRDWTTP